MRAEKDLEHVVNLFEEAERNSRDFRELSFRDRDFYDNCQWTTEELAELEKRGQPPTVINRIHPPRHG